MAVQKWTHLDIRILLCLDSPFCISSLASRVGVPRSSVSRQLERLERDGLVSRHPVTYAFDPSQVERVYYARTPAGSGHLSQHIFYHEGVPHYFERLQFPK